MPGALTWQSGLVYSGDIVVSGQGILIPNNTAVVQTGLFYNDGRSGGIATFGNFELQLSASGFGGNVNANSTVELYLVPAFDGTNTPPIDLSGVGPPANALRGVFTTSFSGNAAAYASRARFTVEFAPLMPIAYATHLRNVTGQTVTSGWTLRTNTYRDYYE